MDGQGAHEVDCMQRVDVVEPDMVADHEGGQPGEADDDDVAAPAVPQVQRMAAGNPWHAERIGPVGQQVHQAAGGETQGRHRHQVRAERGVGPVQQRQPAHAPMGLCFTDFVHCSYCTTTHHVNIKIHQKLKHVPRYLLFTYYRNQLIIEIIIQDFVHQIISVGNR